MLRVEPGPRAPPLGPEVFVDRNWFLSLADASLKCEVFQNEYNNERPFSSIGNTLPVEFMKSIGEPCRPVG